MKRLRENLLLQFSIVSFVIMATIAIGLATVLSNKIRLDAQSNLVNEAVGASSGRLLNEITPSDLDVPMTGDRYDRFHAFVLRAIVSDRTARIKLWADDGTIIYSDDKNGIGEIFPTKEGLMKALDGGNAIEIKVPADPENGRERFLGTLMEVYTPIVFPGSDEPQGALEIYQYYEPTALQIRSTQKWVFLSVGLGFIVLYSSLISIVWGGWRTITRQQSALSQSYAELKASSEKLEKSNQELQDFAFVAAHDLQEPLRKMQTFGDMLGLESSEAIGEQGRDYLTRMRAAAARMSGLINDLLTYSQVSTKVRPFSSVDVSQIAWEVVNELGDEITEAGGHIEFTELPKIYADPVQMRQLLYHLVSNGLKFHRPDEKPVVKIRGEYINGHAQDGEDAIASGQMCRMVVEDNGIGFDQKYSERIFTIFQKLHTGKEYGGNGLGLAVCRKIVENHGGSIEADGRPGSGSSFVITLPTTPREEGL